MQLARMSDPLAACTVCLQGRKRVKQGVTQALIAQRCCAPNASKTNLQFLFDAISSQMLSVVYAKIGLLLLLQTRSPRLSG
jgi:hypothetical protein